jgi:flavin reductase (DIM6/NTAB) family NADH-FMN oxidoreductase RutF
MATPGVIGPFPPRVGDSDEGRDAYDRLRRRVLWSLPYGLYVIGSCVPGQPLKRNLMTANWVTQVSFEPKLVGVAIEHGALTHELISTGGVFTVLTVAREDRAIIRRFTKPVEVDLASMTMNGFAFRDGVTGAPILAQAPAYLDCRVEQSLELGGHTFFVGEVVDCDFQAEEDTPVLRMEDTRMNYGG